jgi:ABC-type Fe3+/spermidine/putrescine transport system ATPase subunit
MSEAARSPEVGGGEPPLVEIRDLKKSYGSVAAVRGVSLTVKRGDAQFIIGPSGCGKSTFLRCINLLEEPSGGSLSQRCRYGVSAIPPLPSHDRA